MREILHRHDACTPVADSDKNANAILSLARPASSFTNGAIFVVDGGHTIY
jgi:hypothetical protein